METLRCRRLIAKPRQGDVMLETCSSPVTSCQGLQWRSGHGCLLGAGSRTGLQEQKRHCKGARSVLERHWRGEQMDMFGKDDFLQFEHGGKPNTYAVGEKFPAELYWQHCYAVCKSDYWEQRVIVCHWPKSVHVSPCLLIWEPCSIRQVTH